MAAFKPAYLIHGDDHGRIAERRARLRALGERDGGAGSVELFEGERATPEEAAAALSAMTLVPGRRFLIVDGVERWRDADLAPLEQALAAMAPETTIAFFAREDGRAQAPKRLHAAVAAAGGDVSEEGSVKPWELPRWVAQHARELGLELEGGAAKALVQHVGERQQRLQRELEKLALMLGSGAHVGADDVDALTAGSAERRVWSLADALAAGRGEAATRLFLELRAQGERLPGLLYWMTQRLRQALDVVTRLEAGQSAAQVRRTLRMPPKSAERFVEEARRYDATALRAALERMADLELDSRGGRAVPEDTAALRAILAIAR